MDKQQDADLEKNREDIQLSFVAYDRAPLLFDDGEDIFEDHVLEESEFEYEPGGAFLD